ncbi:hypothetical protein TUM4438_39590 [Shewanella sairae]|uniref:DUF2975 domain-containing protein n=1 Tax=Shewanella sairae TaxID=190310 RepID=A0ABQ4PQ29_9GAMM|nr:hypothetical protein [Shewanella sairae]MCL1132081.1 hypothetical protein [Shewanella sairae]GIU51120.1 hypothetical protein TUM4438_39590 [Shewanella sairae]
MQKIPFRSKPQWGLLAIFAFTPLLAFALNAELTLLIISIYGLFFIPLISNVKTKQLQNRALMIEALKSAGFIYSLIGATVIIIMTVYNLLFSDTLTLAAVLTQYDYITETLLIIGWLSSLITAALTLHYSTKSTKELKLTI